MEKMNCQYHLAIFMRQCTRYFRYQGLKFESIKTHGIRRLLFYTLDLLSGFGLYPEKLLNSFLLNFIIGSIFYLCLCVGIKNTKSKTLKNGLFENKTSNPIYF